MLNSKNRQDQPLEEKTYPVSSPILQYQICNNKNKQEKELKKILFTQALFVRIYHQIYSNIHQIHQVHFKYQPILRYVKISINSYRLQINFQNQKKQLSYNSLHPDTLRQDISLDLQQYTLNTLSAFQTYATSNNIGCTNYKLKYKKKCDYRLAFKKKGRIINCIYKELDHIKCILRIYDYQQHWMQSSQVQNLLAFPSHPPYTNWMQSLISGSQQQSAKNARHEPVFIGRKQRYSCDPLCIFSASKSSPSIL
eukprot:TRINITY_DN9343_c0_g2_i5.p3 TRINITY_DN9343_c0_g2~~TRINITY_DN9343_c0_g2_i5.p3  ORF type:complete len:253 (-),score=-19.57 TRINITY_DN9343_c0_g2_i5:8-766(-)